MNEEFSSFRVDVMRCILLPATRLASLDLLVLVGTYIIGRAVLTEEEVVFRCYDPHF